MRALRQQSAPSPQKRREEAAPAAARPVVRLDIRREKVPQGKDREPLKEKRRRTRRRLTWVILTALLLLIISVIGAFWLPFVRVQRVDAAGPDSDGVQSLTQTILHGTYYYFFPRNSIFLFPQSKIREQILLQYPDIAAVSISREALNAISVSGTPRQAALKWCGEEYSRTVVTTASTSPATVPTCYNADAQGVVFAALSPDAQPSGESLTLYGALASNPINGSGPDSPLGATIEDATLIPNALQFVKAMRSLGAPVTTLVLRADEADLYTQAGTRITYVLGQEHDAAQLAMSAFPSLNLADGSLDYIDLRFQGKVYFKKVGVDTQASTTTAAH